MDQSEIKEPVQKRSIETKDKIIKAGFDLICEKGYYNTNTAEIAKEANVSTGLVYRYFKDKHDILIEGIKTYASNIFYPAIDIDTTEFNFKNAKELFRDMINKFIENHKLSQTAHEEIMAMVHSDNIIAEFFHEYEITTTNNIVNFLKNNGFDESNLTEKVHIALGLVDNLCHEIVYHKHESINYDKMIDLVLNCIMELLKK